VTLDEVAQTVSVQTTTFSTFQVALEASPPTTIASFTIDPAVVPVGGTATLRWHATGHDPCRRSVPERNADRHEFDVLPDHGDRA
jgi:hypothetical protein